MRRRLLVGNWKMNGDHAALAELAAIAACAATHPGIDVAIAMPATLIAPATKWAKHVAIGAQDIHTDRRGPHTGCLSAPMLREAGATFTLVGHSECRSRCGETDADVRAKARAARRDGLFTLICIGETLAQRASGRAEAIVADQLIACVPPESIAEGIAVAYEPIWAIGTGRTPLPRDVAAMHAALRAAMRGLLGAEADRVRLLYGGSVNESNAAELLGQADVDGLLVGNASLAAHGFAPIITAAGVMR